MTIIRMLLGFAAVTSSRIRSAPGGTAGIGVLKRALRRRRLLVVALLGGVLAYVGDVVGRACGAGAGADRLVHTESGGVVRDVPVLVGGVPTSIDVDGVAKNGLRTPDIDVSVGLVAVEELPEGVLVPNIVVKRNLLALLSNTPAPPLKLNARIVLTNAGIAPLATIDYGFETPPGARMPGHGRRPSSSARSRPASSIRSSRRSRPPAIAGR